MKYNSVLDDIFVAIVDDWNHYKTVAVGTNKAFKELGYVVHYGEVLGGGYENNEANSPWHNGLYVAVVEKPKVAA